MRESVYVNKEKGTVVVVLDNVEMDVIRAVRRIMRQADPRGIFGFRPHNSYLIGPFRGRARLHPDDAWNEQTGIELARSRAMRVYQRAINREVLLIMNTMTEIENGLEDLLDYSVMDMVNEPYFPEATDE